jgi:DNA-binding IclR family transcriptional regulator
LLLASVVPSVRKEFLAPLAERDPEAAILLEKKIIQAGQQGYATSEEEIHKGVWAAAAQVMHGKRMVAVLTVPYPLVRAPAEQRAQLLGRVRTSARAIENGLRLARR